MICANYRGHAHRAITPEGRQAKGSGSFLQKRSKKLLFCRGHGIWMVIAEMLAGESKPILDSILHQN
jgi:hypothetical protein